MQPIHDEVVRIKGQVVLLAPFIHYEGEEQTTLFCYSTSLPKSICIGTFALYYEDRAYGSNVHEN